MKTGHKRKHLHMAIINRGTWSGLKAQQRRASHHALEKGHQWQYSALGTHGPGMTRQSWKQKNQEKDHLRHAHCVNAGQGALQMKCILTVESTSKTPTAIWSIFPFSPSSFSSFSSSSRLGRRKTATRMQSSPFPFVPTSQKVLEFIEVIDGLIETFLIHKSGIKSSPCADF